MKTFEEQIEEQNETWRNDSTGTAHALEPVLPESAEPMRGPHLPTATIEELQGYVAYVEKELADAAPPATPAPEEIEEELLSVKSASRVMDVTYGQVYRLCEGGIIRAKHVQSGGKKAFAIRKNELKKWLARPGQKIKYKTVDWGRQ